MSVEAHDPAIAPLLGDIGARTFEQTGVVVTLLVHHRGGTDPGPGFTSRLPPRPTNAQVCVQIEFSQAPTGVEINDALTVLGLRVGDLYVVGGRDDRAAHRNARRIEVDITPAQAE